MLEYDVRVVGIWNLGCLLILGFIDLHWSLDWRWTENRRLQKGVLILAGAPLGGLGASLTCPHTPHLCCISPKFSLVPSCHCLSVQGQMEALDLQVQELKDSLAHAHRELEEAADQRAQCQQQLQDAEQQHQSQLLGAKLQVRL